MKSVLTLASLISLSAILTIPTVALADIAKIGISKGGSVQLIASKSRYNGEIVFMRGGFNQFSLGLDKMSKILRQRGVKSRVVTHFEKSATVNAIAAKFNSDGKKPVVLVGHSWGANGVIEVAKGLKAKGIKVNYLVTFAPTNPSPVPSNVGKMTNYYFGEGGWGSKVIKGSGFKGILKNVNLSDRKTIGHFNIDKDPKIQNQVLRNILRIVRNRRSS